MTLETSLGGEIASRFFDKEDPAFTTICSLFTALSEGELSFAMPEEPPSSLLKAIEKGAPFCIEGAFLYLERDYVREGKFIQKWLSIATETPAPHLQELDLSSYPLTDEQRAISKGVFSRTLEILTGGPGTGKTFLASIWIEAFLRQFPKAKVVICAPTGKATSHLKSKLHHLDTIQAMTLHRLLHEAKGVGRIDYDLIVVDEASMVDFSKMLELLERKKRGSRLLLLGDPNQLPPVEAGFIFRDLATTEYRRTLTRCLRAEIEAIFLLAEAIRLGDFDLFLARLSEHSSHLIWKKSFDETLSPPFLTATRRGELGSETLNALFLEKEAKKGFEIKHLPILITQNILSLGLANGDSGLLKTDSHRLLDLHKKKRASKEDRALFFGKELPANLIPAFDFGFALSIHKSQGSELDHPTILLGVGSDRFDRSLLYTAVTRAKKGLTLVADPALLQSLFSKKPPRESGFLHRLKKSL